MSRFLEVVILLFVVLDFVIEQSLAYLNHRSSHQPLPAELSEVYSAEEHAKSVAYGDAKYRFGLVQSTVSFLVVVIAIVAGVFGAVDRWVGSITDNRILVSLGFFAVIGAFNSMLSLPFSVYSTFVIEERFGFNRTTVSTFVLDLIKGLLLGTVLGGAVLAAVVTIYDVLQGGFWIAAWGLLAAVSLFMFMFSTSLILPLFNKVSPLEPGELRTAIEEYCATQGYEIGRLFVMDASKRSSKANAFFSGIGRRKTIVLFDTLIEKLDTRETTAVLAHEVGHYKLRHTLSMFLFSSAQSLLLFALLGAFLGNADLARALGADHASFHISGLAFLFLFQPISMVLGFVSTYWTRRNELSADQFAKRTYDAGPLGTGLTKISSDSLSNLTPHPLYVKAYYTHPPLKERLAALD